MKKRKHPVKIVSSKKIGRRKSIKKEMFHKISSIAIGISVIFGIINIIMLYQNTRKSMKNEVNTAVTAYGSSIQNAIDKLKLSAEIVARNDYITDPGRELADKKAVLTVLAKQYGFHDISVADAHGKTYNDTDISDRDYFKQAINGKTYVSSTMVRKTDSSTIMFAAARINNSTNYQGIVYCAVDISRFNSMIKDVKIGDTGYGFVLDKKGTVIADQDLDNVNQFANYIDKAKEDQSLSGMSSVSKAMIAGQNGGQTVTRNGRKLYIAYTPISDTDGWSIGVVAVENELMGNLYTAVYITAALILLFILLSIILSNFISKPIVNPVLSLVKRMQTLARGDLRTEVPAVYTKDEIQVLSEAFSDTVSSLKNYIEEISYALNSMSGGDFSVQIQQDYLGDFVAIKDSLNQIILSLNEMFRDIYALAGRVTNGSQQVASGAKALAQGAAEQAGTIQELSASVHEIADEAEQSAKSAAGADEISGKALKEIANGNQKMSKMIEAMEKIDESSGEIGKIVKTIEDIAFQTNILALNAAVEAARAGEAGKGFSVVADEVRNLAGKSSQAVQNTTVLIQNSVNAVQEGRNMAEDTAKSLQSIIQEVEKMAELIREISKASGNQAKEMSQINAGMDRISSVVQTTSATAEQSAATSEELDRLAHSLKNTLDQLTLLEEKNSEISSSEPEARVVS